MLALPDKAFVLERRTAEVEEQTNVEAGGFEVVDDLSFFNSTDARKCFEVDDHGLEANEVGHVLAAERLALVQDAKLDVRLEWDLARGKLDLHGLLINCLQKAATELGMHLHGSADDRIRLRVPFVVHCLL